VAVLWRISAPKRGRDEKVDGVHAATGEKDERAIGGE
jgi:hypothetical protein